MKLYFNIGMNTMYQVIGRVVTAAVALVSTRLMTGALGVEGYGEFQVIVTYVTLFWILTDFGLNSIAVREMAADEEQLPQIFSALVTLRGMFGVGLVAISWLLLLITPYSLVVKQGIMVAAITIFFQSMIGSANGLFQVKLRYDQQLISNVISSTISLGVLFATVVYGWGLWGFIASFISTSVSRAIINVILANRWVSVRLSHDRDRLGFLFKETLPFGAALLFSLATTKVDAIMLSVMALPGMTNEVAVGVYNLAYRIFELVLVFPVFFMNPVYPVLVRHFQESLQKFKKSIFKAELVLIVTSALVTVVIYILAPWLVQILADAPGFEDSIKVLRILIIWAPLFFSTALLMWILVTLNKQRELIIIYASGFVFNIIGNAIFIPQYGYFAAAVTTGITEALIFILLLVFVIKNMRAQKGAKQEIV